MSATSVIQATSPTAAGRLPLIGHALALWRRPFEFLCALADIGEVVRVDLAGSPTYFLTTPALIHDVLVGQGRVFDKGRIFDRMIPLFGNGLITSTESFHRQQRRTMQPLFSHAHVADWVAIMHRQAQRLVDSWRPGQTVAVDDIMYELTCRTVTEIMFSQAATGNVVKRMQSDLPRMSRDTVRRALTPSAVQRIIPDSFASAPGRIQATLDQLIGHYRANPEQHDGDLLGLILSAQDDAGRHMSDLQARDELLTILVAGTEPTAVTLAWMFHELGRHPAVLDRLRAEINDVLGGNPVTAADVDRLPSLTNVLNETVRLHPALVIMRRPVVDVRIGPDALPVPAGTEIAFSPYAVHRDSRFYPNPRQFDPDRWDTADTATLPKGAYVPFSDGTRRCIGEHFGWTEMVVAATAVLARWNLRPTAGCQVRPVAAGIPRISELPMTVHPHHLTQR
jgi:cytochrome P450